MTSTLEMARAERLELTDFLGTLTPQQWATPSLCTDWTVRDVVAHMFSYEELGTVGVLARIVRGRFVNANQIGVDEFSPSTPGEMLAYVRNHQEPTGLTGRFGGLIALVDGMIHHQDIRRALALPRAIPSERLVRVLGLIPNNPRLGAWPRIRGLRLRATDLEWSHGTGTEVSGTGEALMMAMAGRPAALDDLAGPGLATLTARLT